MNVYRYRTHAGADFDEGLIVAESMDEAVRRYESELGTAILAIEHVGEAYVYLREQDPTP